MKIKIKKLTVRVDERTHAAYRKALFDKGITAQEHLSKCIERFIKKAEREKGGK